MSIIIITMVAITILLLSLKEFLFSEFTMILVLLMFILDGVSILLAKDIFKIASKEVGLAIMLGMIIRVLIFLITQKRTI
tara:strand:- start:303 stop:542 length:240 start_codon:yes stop_codon:yes gene_type:complete